MILLLVTISAGVYFLIGLTIAMLSIAWDHFLPEDFHLIDSEETLESHCIKLAFAWPLFLIIYALWMVGFLLLIVVNHTAKPFDNYLKRKR